MDSYLVLPNGSRLEGIKYYDIADAAKQIVNTKIKDDENLKNKFNEFKNSDTAKNFNEKAKEFGARAFEAAKNSLKTKKTGEDKKDDNK